jgi:hypothetical protein
MDKKRVLKAAEKYRDAVRTYEQEKRRVEELREAARAADAAHCQAERYLEQSHREIGYANVVLTAAICEGL